MGLRKCGVRRVVLANVMLLLHNYFMHSAAIASAPQPSPPLPFDGLLPISATNGTFDTWDYLIIQGRGSERAYGFQIRNVSNTVQDINTTSNRCSNQVNTVVPNYDFLEITMQELSCLYPAPIRFKVDNATSSSVFSFSTQFSVTMTLEIDGAPSTGSYNDVNNGLQGFTFAILPLDANQSLAGDGGYLGLLNATSNGNNQSHTVAVEFDFKYNPEFSDPTAGYHIGLNINSMNSTSWTLIPGPAAKLQIWTLQVWIDYDGSSHMLTVTTLDISSSSTDSFNFDCATNEERPPALGLSRYAGAAWTSNSQRVDLSTVLNEFMYVGFTSSGLSSPDQMSYELYVGSWTFRTSNSSPPAPSAPLLCFSVRGPTFFQKHAFDFTLTFLLTGLLALSVIYGTSYMYYRRWVERRGWRFHIDDDDLGASDPHKFTYKELALATKNFDEKHALGRGGFGSVYKGFLPGNKQDVAVKRVSAESKQGEREFLAEVMIIGKLRHRNLVRLQGWCHERGELLLVYDYMPNGSLDKLLFRTVDMDPHELPTPVPEEHRLDEVSLNTGVVNIANPRFPWERRFKIIVDVATALVYLHTECEERIIHRDVKAANVMLDAKFNARLGDFGLARSYNHSLLTPESTNVAGTFGYLAPELFHTGKQTEQTDVYSFGAFLLEVACGRKPIFREDDEVGVLVDHVWRMWGDSKILDTADPELAGMFDEGEMTKVLCLGLMCSHPSPAMRPSMRQVLLILKGDISLPHVPSAKPRVSEEIRRSLSEDLSRSTKSDPESYSPLEMDDEA